MCNQWILLWLILGGFLMPAAVYGQATEQAESTPFSPFKPEAQGPSPDLADVVQQIINRTNAFRQEEGHPQVQTNPQLMETAQDFARFMARTDKYGHTADGKQPVERAQQHGYDPCLIAENIAYQYSTTGFTTEQLAQGFFQGWQQSPEHRQNMLDPALTEIGVGVAQSAETGTYYAVQLFGRPQAQRFEFQVANRSPDMIEYTLGDRTWQLPPQVTRTHQQCRPTALTVYWPEQQEETTVQPKHGAHYTIVRGDSGGFQLQEG